MTSQKEKSQGKWSCDVCMVSNDNELTKCSACETQNPKAPAAAALPANLPTGGFSGFLAKQKTESQGKWACDVCMIQNAPENVKCSACETPNPKAPAASSSAGTSQESTSSKFAFGLPSQPDSQNTPGVSFGVKPAESEAKVNYSFSIFTFGKLNVATIKTMTNSLIWITDPQRKDPE